MGGAASQEEEEYLNYQQKAKSWGWIAISAFVLFMLVMDPIIKYAVENHSSGAGMIFLLAIVCIPMFIWAANASKRNARKPAYQKSRETMGQIDQFRTIISPYAGSSGPSRSIPDDSEDAFAGRD
jgi:Na+/melibiose symporter-like transporter